AANIQGYQFKTMTLDALPAIYNYLATDSFSGNVSCGLNDGGGVPVAGGFAGYLVSGCSGLPNKGALGMFKEFDAIDANGPRSATFYAYSDFVPDLATHLTMLVYGALPLD